MKYRKCVFRFSNLMPQLQKIFYLHFDNHFVSCSYESAHVAAILDFFHLNLLASNVLLWSTKLLQLNHIIVNMFSSILIVNYKKNEGDLIFKGQIKVLLSKTLGKKIIFKILQ